MSATKYRIVFSGGMVSGMAGKEVLANLCRLFRTDEARVRTLFRGKGAVIASGVDHDRAKQMQSKLEEAGVFCRMEEMAETEAAQIIIPSQDDLPIAPPVPPVSASTASPEARVTSFQPYPQAAAETPSAGQPASMLMIALLLLLVAGVWWWLNHPAGGGIPAGAHINNTNRYAVVPPEEWLMLTPQNYRVILDQYGERLPQELRRMVSKPGFDVSFVKLPADETSWSPSVNVVMVPMKGTLPTLTEKEKDKAAVQISKELTANLPSYRMESSKIVEVDGIPSLQIAGVTELRVVLKPATAIMSAPSAFGLRHVTGHTEAEVKTFQLRMVQTFVPGKEKGFVITCTEEDAGFEAMNSVFTKVTQSFRVMDHPPRFGRIVMGSLNGGLIGACIYLAWMLIGRIGKRED